MRKAIKRVELKTMPFDARIDGVMCHATGYYVLLDNGTWVEEYEGHEWEDSQDCIYESEWDDEEEDYD